jgi:hypothetical protein
MKTLEINAMYVSNITKQESIIVTIAQISELDCTINRQIMVIKTLND